jgi:hypothetical protein
MNTLVEMAALALQRPSVDATPDQLAAWYEAKGRLHEHLAADLVDSIEQAAELAYAAAAFEHARQLAVMPV